MTCRQFQMRKAATGNDHKATMDSRVDSIRSLQKSKTVSRSNDKAFSTYHVRFMEIINDDKIKNELTVIASMHPHYRAV